MDNLEKNGNEIKIDIYWHGPLSYFEVNRASFVLPIL